MPSSLKVLLISRIPLPFWYLTASHNKHKDHQKYQESAFWYLIPSAQLLYSGHILLSFPWHYRVLLQSRQRQSALTLPDVHCTPLLPAVHIPVPAYTLPDKSSCFPVLYRYSEDNCNIPVFPYSSAINHMPALNIFLPAGIPQNYYKAYRY